MAKALNIISQLYPIKEEDQKENLYDLIGRMMAEEQEDEQ